MKLVSHRTIRRRIIWWFCPRLLARLLTSLLISLRSPSCGPVPSPPRLFVPVLDSLYKVRRCLLSAGLACWLVAVACGILEEVFGCLLACLDATKRRKSVSRRRMLAGGCLYG